MGKCYIGKRSMEKRRMEKRSMGKYNTGEYTLAYSIFNIHIAKEVRVKTWDKRIMAVYVIDKKSQKMRNPEQLPHCTPTVIFLFFLSLRAYLRL